MNERNEYIATYISKQIGNELSLFMKKYNLTIDDMKENGEVIPYVTSDGNILVDIIYKYKRSGFILPDDSCKYGLFAVDQNGNLIGNVKYKQSLLFKKECYNGKIGTNIPELC